MKWNSTLVCICICVVPKKQQFRKLTPDDVQIWHYWLKLVHRRNQWWMLRTTVIVPVLSVHMLKKSNKQWDYKASIAGSLCDHSLVYHINWHTISQVISYNTFTDSVGEGRVTKQRWELNTHPMHDYVSRGCERPKSPRHPTHLHTSELWPRTFSEGHCTRLIWAQAIACLNVHI